MNTLNSGDGSSSRSNILYVTGLTALGLLLTPVSQRDATGQNGYDLLGGTSGLIKRASSGQAETLTGGKGNLADFGKSAGY